jgi:hypothetical protein
VFVEAVGVVADRDAPALALTPSRIIFAAAAVVGASSRKLRA